MPCPSVLTGVFTTWRYINTRLPLLMFIFKRHFDACDDDDDNYDCDDDDHETCTLQSIWNNMNLIKFFLYDAVYLCSAVYLYDAVYLYLLTVNQTLAEGYSNYRDGRLIRNKTVGQRFAGKRSARIHSSI